MAKKIYLEGINFDFTEDDDPKGIGPHISYTTAASGGAAIGNITNNEAYLLKSLDVHEDTSETNKDATSGGSTDDKTQDTGRTTKTKVNKENTTLDEKVLKDVQAQLAVLKQERDDLKKSLKVQEIEKSLIAYKFTEETQKALADVMVSIEDTKPITDAFDEIVKSLEEVAKAKGKKDATEGDNPLTKMLDKEVGDAGDPDAGDVDKSLVDQINEAAALV